MTWADRQEAPDQADGAQECMRNSKQFRSAEILNMYRVGMAIKKTLIANRSWTVLRKAKVKEKAK